MAPPAPALLSTTTGTLICLLSESASSRMLMSLPPPAGQATIRVIGSEGKLCACKGAPAVSGTAAARATAANVDKILRFISCLLLTVVVLRRVGERLGRQKLCPKLLNDIERKHTVLGAAKQPQYGLIDSRIDEVAQPLAAMLRCPCNAEGFDRFISNERGGAGDVAPGNRGNHGLLIDCDTGGLDVGAEEFVAHDEGEFLPHRIDGFLGVMRSRKK